MCLVRQQLPSATDCSQVPPVDAARLQVLCCAKTAAYGLGDGVSTCGLGTSAGAGLQSRPPGSWDELPVLLSCLQVLDDACTADGGLTTAVYLLCVLGMSGLCLACPHCFSWHIYRCWLVPMQRTMAWQLGCSPNPCRRQTGCPGGLQAGMVWVNCWYVLLAALPEPTAQWSACKANAC